MTRGSVFQTNLFYRIQKQSNVFFSDSMIGRMCQSLWPTRTISNMNTEKLSVSKPSFLTQVSWPKGYVLPTQPRSSRFMNSSLSLVQVFKTRPKLVKAYLIISTISIIVI
jgi:hypothetical protein